MADNKIQGRAKKFDGTAIDYVSIFNWDDGKCIAQVVPDVSGNWQYKYPDNLQVGITYVADGCEPITHGAYELVYKSNTPVDTILHYAFDGDVLDQSVNALNGIKTGNTNFVAGRKAGTQALEFVAGCVQTPQVLPINSSKLTISFWMSVNQISSAVIYESGTETYYDSDAFSGQISTAAQGIFSSWTIGSGGNQLNIVDAAISADSTWQHVLITIDRSKAGGEDQQDIYINNELSTNNTSYAVAANRIFANKILYIGQRNASSLPFVGKLQDMRLYNRVLTDAERTTLFNE